MLPTHFDVFDVFDASICCDQSWLDDDIFTAEMSIT